jgi:hypothetical protein
MKKTLLCTMLALSAGAASAADTASWAHWTGTTGTFVQNSNTVTVTYTGDSHDGDQRAAIFDTAPSSFTAPPLVTNTPGANGTIDMTGGHATVNSFHFSQAVVDPLVALWSIGNSGTPVTFNFLDDAKFSILSQGAGNWGGGSLVQAGNSVTGREGNGLLQFKGTYTDISFTTPDYESYYGATVGAIAAVPEPETYAMILAGLGVIGAMVRRRKD